MTAQRWPIRSTQQTTHQPIEPTHDLRPRRSRQSRRASGQVLDVLSPREWEVLNLIVLGKTDRQIADELFLSRITVSNHVSHILGKLEVPNRTAAATVALAAMHNRVSHSQTQREESSR